MHRQLSASWLAPTHSSRAGVRTPRVSVGMPNVAAMGATGATQLSFADSGPAWDPAAFATGEVSLRETTFVVVDLETTGGRTRSTDATPRDAITEIGAVKVR